MLRKKEECEVAPLDKVYGSGWKAAQGRGLFEKRIDL
jgi:hypothetical protein